VLSLGTVYCLSAQQPAPGPSEDPPVKTTGAPSADPATAAGGPPAAAPTVGNPSAAPAGTGVVPGTLSEEERRKAKAEAEVRRQEHQRILGLAPNFNTSNVKDAEPLSAKQKFELAAHSVTDPFTFLAAGFDALLSQAEDDFKGYGQGAQGYGKRFGASYLDSFDGTMIGNAIFPALLKQDPRYYRQGTGSFRSRFFHAVISTVECKNDNRKWAPNYSNVLGNLVAGGISNLYYPASDRGVGLTFERAATVTGEGAIGSVFVEFWPDISRRMFRKKNATATP
jgi:hypothetical protein